VIVTLLTDYGLEDEWVGVCHGVVLAGCPDARIVDLTHGIASFDVRHGALTLRNALPHVPVGVHMAVVDPGVGTARRAVAVATGDGRRLVGPDNGLLSLAWERCGGTSEAVEISASPVRREPVSATFHGRDLFAPVAAALASGATLADVGEPLEPASLVVMTLPAARVVGSSVIATCLLADGFGNLALGAGAAEVESAGWTSGTALGVDAAGAVRLARFGRTFGDVERGDLLVHLDANGALALGMRDGSAARLLALGRDDRIRLFPA
jgi:S-adenosylmethionine hydrolase